MYCYVYNCGDCTLFVPICSGPYGNEFLCTCTLHYRVSLFYITPLFYKTSPNHSTALHHMTSPHHNSTQHFIIIHHFHTALYQTNSLQLTLLSTARLLKNSYSSLDSKSAPRLRYRVEVPADQEWGIVKEDGTVTGMVGEVVARRAHLAINEITITGKYIPLHV